MVDQVLGTVEAGRRARARGPPLWAQQPKRPFWTPISRPLWLPWRSWPALVVCRGGGCCCCCPVSDTTCVHLAAAEPSPDEWRATLLISHRQYNSHARTHQPATPTLSGHTGHRRHVAWTCGRGHSQKEAEPPGRSWRAPSWRERRTGCGGSVGGGA